MRKNFVVYDSWDLTLPKARPRSRLNPLNPMGVGTPFSESCTGYIGRLSAEHWTSVGSLFGHRIAPAANKPSFLSTKFKFEIHAWTAFMPEAHSLNGLGAIAKDWIEVLQTLTQRSDLRCLTMLRWSNVLSEHSLSRSIHAWCPLCYQAERNSGGVVYDQLLWSLVTVEVCPRHSVGWKPVVRTVKGKHVPSIAGHVQVSAAVAESGWAFPKVATETIEHLSSPIKLPTSCGSRNKWESSLLGRQVWRLTRQSAK
jgi:hypothetical protein